LKKIGELIKESRDKNGLLLRQVAAEIEIDTALLSKIERGERMPTKDQVIRLAKFYRTNENEFLVAYLSDKLVSGLQNEKYALSALQEAERKISTIVKSKSLK
jgi:transcriptional regulator with XRE-family HTH domain